MGVIGFAIKKPAGPAWHSIFDNTKWQDSPGANRATNTWNGSADRWHQYWEPPGGESGGDTSSRLAVNGSWFTDFRTDTQLTDGEFRITMAASDFDPSSVSFTIKLRIGTDDLTAVRSGLVWSVTNINLNPSDISYIEFLFTATGESNGTVLITNIEFFYDASNPTPGGNWGAGA